MNVHDPEGNMSGAGMIKTGAGNLSGFSANCQDTAPRIECLIDLTKEQGI